MGLLLEAIADVNAASHHQQAEKHHHGENADDDFHRSVALGSCRRGYRRNGGWAGRYSTGWNWRVGYRGTTFFTEPCSVG